MSLDRYDLVSASFLAILIVIRFLFPCLVYFGLVHCSNDFRDVLYCSRSDFGSLSLVGCSLGCLQDRSDQRGKTVRERPIGEKNLGLVVLVSIIYSQCDSTYWQIKSTFSCPRRATGTQFHAPKGSQHARSGHISAHHSQTPQKNCLYFTKHPPQKPKGRFQCRG